MSPGQSGNDLLALDMNADGDVLCQVMCDI